MATSDVEMRLDDVRDAAHGDDAAEHHSPITVDSPTPPPQTTSEQHEHSSPRSSSSRSSLSPSNEASSPSSAHPASAGAKLPSPSTSTKPRSSASGHKARSPSPSPPPPPVKPPPQTIRLDIALGGPEDYEVDIRSLSKETGQRAPTPPILISVVGRDESDESEPEEPQNDLKPKKRRKRKNAAQEYYDTSDPFIDDSELAVDERTFFAQTKQQGFYVSSGQVALLTDKAPAKKPKSRASKKFILPPSVSISAALSNATLPPSLSAPLSTSSLKLNSGNKMPISKVINETISAPPGPSKLVKTDSGDGLPPGTKDSPIPLDDDVPSYAVGPTSGAKRKASMDEEHPANASVASISGEGENKKRKKAVQIKAFHPELETLIEELKDAIAKEDWSAKGKFPQTLKPLLSRVALKAIVLNEYNENFFNFMPKIFPYNRFTMTKLIKRTIWRDHTNLLVERQNALLVELKKLADEGFAKAQEEWERSVQMWERRQTVRTDPQDGLAPPPTGQAQSAEGTPVPSSAQPTPLLGPTSLPPAKSIDDSVDMDVDDVHGANGKQPTAKDAHPPAKRYRLTDQMKGIIWALVCLSNECCRIENEKNELENNHQIVSDQGVRKTLYQKIVASYPDGWLSSGQISREVSVMKKKYERDVMENDVEA